VPNENISVPYGLVKTVEHYLGSVGILDLLDGFKERGVPLRHIVLAMCSRILLGSNSMTRCADWLSNPNVGKELGIEKKLSQRTINRAVNIIGCRSDEMVMWLWRGLDDRYRFQNTDVNIDGSAVVFNGPRSELGARGYPRDYKDKSREQVEFMTVQLQQSRIPFFIRAYPGNTADVVQYRDVLPDLFNMLRQGSWMIMDNGGASGDILDSIVKSGNRYLTRVKMNKSDDLRIADNGDEWEYVEDGVCCLRHSFESSGRTTYLFFSVENWMRSYNIAERRAYKMIEAVRTYEDGKFKMADFVTVKRNVLAEIDVTVSVQTKLPYEGEDVRESIVSAIMDQRSGIFKLESSERLPPSEALRKYRARSTVEHLISSFKRVTGIKPLRVWKESSIRGSMMLALLAETAMAMARYELHEYPKEAVRSGRKATADVRPCTEFMVWPLSQLTVCRIVEKGRRKQAIYSNWDAISRAVFSNIRDGFVRKPPIPG